MANNEIKRIFINNKKMSILLRDKNNGTQTFMVQNEKLKKV